jgi:hypothetical protein
MAHEDYETKVDDAFSTEWLDANLPQLHALDFRCRVAECLFHEEPLDVQMAMEREATAAHEVALAAHASCKS